jgi:hypothetical protein
MYNLEKEVAKSNCNEGSVALHKNIEFLEHTVVQKDEMIQNLRAQLELYSSSLSFSFLISMSQWRDACTLDLDMGFGWHILFRLTRSISSKVLFNSDLPEELLLLFVLSV